MNLGIIGGGRAAWAFGSALREASWTIAGVWLRSESTSPIARLLATSMRPLDDLVAASEILLLAVSDGAITEMLDRIRPHVRSDSRIFHASGSMTSEVFSGLRGGFSLHPLRSLPPVGEPVDLRGTLFVFEGAGASRPAAEAIANAAGGRFIEIARDQKILYHAAAVFGSNYVAGVLEIAQELLAEAGIANATRQDLANLAFSAIENWLHQERAARFTGPVARGDGDLIANHLEALARSPNRREIYRLLALELCAILERDKPELRPLANRILGRDS